MTLVGGGGATMTLVAVHTIAWGLTYTHWSVVVVGTNHLLGLVYYIKEVNLCVELIEDLN